MKQLTIELPDELADDLERCADWHGVPVDDVVRHAVAEDVEFAKEHELGPWGDGADINFEVPEHLMRT